MTLFVPQIQLASFFNFVINLVPMATLRRLNASHNRLELLPKDLGFSSHLKVLDLSENLLKVISDKIYDLASLEVINLAGNQIQTLPVQFGVKMINLVELYMERNWIGELPKKLSGWKRNLKVLCMNHISIIYAISSDSRCFLAGKIQSGIYPQR